MRIKAPLDTSTGTRKACLKPARNSLGNDPRHAVQHLPFGRRRGRCRQTCLGASWARFKPVWDTLFWPVLVLSGAFIRTSTLIRPFWAHYNYYSDRRDCFGARNDSYSDRRDCFGARNDSVSAESGSGVPSARDLFGPSKTNQ